MSSLQSITPTKKHDLSSMEFLCLRNSVLRILRKKQRMKAIPYTLALGSLIYVMLCTRPNICYVVGIVNRYQSNLEPKHRTKVKYIFKYLRRTRYYMLTYRGSDLIPVYYTFYFMSDMSSKKSTSEYVFTRVGST